MQNLLALQKIHGDDKTNKYASYLFIFMEAQLIYNIMLVSTVQPSDSVTYIYIFKDSFPLQAITKY